MKKMNLRQKINRCAENIKHKHNSSVAKSTNIYIYILVSDKGVAFPRKNESPKGFLKCES